MRGKGSKLGEPCLKVMLSQDRLPVEQAYLMQMSLAQMSLNLVFVPGKQSIPSLMFASKAGAYPRDLDLVHQD